MYGLCLVISSVLVSIRFPAVSEEGSETSAQILAEDSPTALGLCPNNASRPFVVVVFGSRLVRSSVLPLPRPTMETLSSVWLPRIVQLLSGPSALKALRCSRSLKRLWPQCLQAGEGFWILGQLKTITLEELLARDEDLCNCFRWARGHTESCKIEYWQFPTVEIYASMPTPEPPEEKDEQDPKEVIVRSLSESFVAMNGNESFELTKRLLGFPRRCPKPAGNVCRCFEGSGGGVASSHGYGPFRLGDLRNPRDMPGKRLAKFLLSSPEAKSSPGNNPFEWHL